MSVEEKALVPGNFATKSETQGKSKRRKGQAHKGRSRPRPSGRFIPARAHGCVGGFQPEPSGFLSFPWLFPAGSERRDKGPGAVHGAFRKRWLFIRHPDSSCAPPPPTATGRPRGVTRWKRAGPGRRPGEAQPERTEAGAPRALGRKGLPRPPAGPALTADPAAPPDRRPVRGLGALTARGVHPCFFKSRFSHHFGGQEPAARLSACSCFLPAAQQLTKRATHIATPCVCPSGDVRGCCARSWGRGPENRTSSRDTKQHFLLCSKTLSQNKCDKQTHGRG